MSLARNFAQFVLRGRVQAIGMALLFSFIPLLGWMSVAIVVLVTLSKGAYEGFLVILWAALPYVVLGAMHMWMPFFNSVVFGLLFVWCLTLLLKRHASWIVALEIGTFVGILGVIGIHLYYPDIAQWWVGEITQSIQRIMEFTPLSFNMDRINKILPVFAQFATGIQAAIVVFAAISELMVGRFLQSIVQLPQAWLIEWLNFRVSTVPTVLLIVDVSLAWFNVSFSRDVLPVLLLPFLLVGLSVIHATLLARRLSKLKIAILFILLAILMGVFPVTTIGLLVVIAVLDVVIDFRKRVEFRVR
ncbi:MAG: hypothetical protein A3C55_04620 [Gammaproteobacteria bacterium RIFCSPHIGHO2_02_FULL_42_13]|nr:MAG: hypothetical protein A3C55_04620 [Gammaproteobacteria bacterium RIFCSPHIGHO2_02_FULL_42_13]OGT68057.1 MAG: hypothetical protein A3H43_02110 [Gammaproteobacteria bacterium RIFCSPLOWO2_02_FULL_42_9]